MNCQNTCRTKILGKRYYIFNNGSRATWNAGMA